MPSVRMTLCGRTVLFAAAALLSCSSDDTRPAASGGVFPSSDGGGGTGAAGGGGGGGVQTAGAGGEGGSAGSTLDAGQDAPTDADVNPDGSTPICGNNIREGTEVCDGTDLGWVTCESYGYTDGTLACVGCNADVSGCTGVEGCWDGLDNDGDHLVDCQDPDCESACTDPCASPPVIADPATIMGTNTGHGDVFASSCVKVPPSGPDLVYQFNPAHTGIADIVLTSQGADFTLSTRTACEAAASETACMDLGAGVGGFERVQVDCHAGEPLFIVIDGKTAEEKGPFQLSASSRPITCGDGNRDPGEECDDGDTTAGDGCSPTCAVESNETEPNDTVAQADSYVASFRGVLSSNADVDYVELTVAHTPSSVFVDTLDFGDDACAQKFMDPAVELLAADGTTVLADDDDSGAGFCAHAGIAGLAAGTYYVKVYAASAVPPPYPYVLSVVLDRCGNGVVTEFEECDDANNTANDGCSPTCTKEW